MGGLTYCEGCHTIEGGTKEEQDTGCVVCVLCGDEVTFIPEHDDWDMERYRRIT